MYSTATTGPDGRIFVIGGIDASDTWLNTVDAYDPISNSWSTVAPMPTIRSHAAATVVDGMIFVIGGQDSLGTPLDTVEVYDPIANTWDTLSSLSTPRIGAAAVTAPNGLVYAFGGGDGIVGLSSAEVYNFAPTAVPEPGTAALFLSLACTGVLALRRKHRA